MEWRRQHFANSCRVPFSFSRFLHASPFFFIAIDKGSACSSIHFTRSHSNGTVRKCLRVIIKTEFAQLQTGWWWWSARPSGTGSCHFITVLKARLCCARSSSIMLKMHYCLRMVLIAVRVGGSLAAPKEVSLQSLVRRCIAWLALCSHVNR